MTKIDIREVGDNSLETAFFLLRRFFEEEGFDTPAEEMRSLLDAMISAPNSAVFLAWQENEPVGVASVTTSIGLEYGRSAEMEDLYVLPGSRKQGVASMLIEEICAWCEQNGVSVLLVTVTAEGNSKHNLVDYYLRHGFTNKKRVILERSLKDD